MSSNERFIREQIRKILHESSSTLLVENQFGDFASTSQMYKTFIGPFVNVFKVAKTAFQDITSATNRMQAIATSLMELCFTDDDVGGVNLEEDKNFKRKDLLILKEQYLVIINEEDLLIKKTRSS